MLLCIFDLLKLWLNIFWFGKLVVRVFYMWIEELLMNLILLCGGGVVLLVVVNWFMFLV